eukprot:TRINITY_DN63494_c0_g1_i1.p1 TRINITY_DN63494_c0_g1~~TRINITY_DN63494_c0_g1_i1.p1  ORF type:complete len:209 (+),score=32.36 TRINITY_DN63494_c0_g1_i1:118-744(+)
MVGSRWTPAASSMLILVFTSVCAVFSTASAVMNSFASEDLGAFQDVMVDRRSAEATSLASFVMMGSMTQTALSKDPPRGPTPAANGGPFAAIAAISTENAPDVRHRPVAPREGVPSSMTDPAVVRSSTVTPAPVGENDQEKKRQLSQSDEATAKAYTSMTILLILVALIFVMMEDDYYYEDLSEQLQGMRDREVHERNGFATNVPNRW